MNLHTTISEHHTVLLCEYPYYTQSNRTVRFSLFGLTVLLQGFHQGGIQLQ
jgi:hypothetical protein